MVDGQNDGRRRAKKKTVGERAQIERVVFRKGVRRRNGAADAAIDLLSEVSQMKRRVFALLAGLVAGVPALTGCGAQADPGYAGEPLATISGAVVTGSHAPAQVDAAVLWVTSHAGVSRLGVTPRLIAARVSVGSTFPATFTLALNTPPPAETEWTNQKDGAPATVDGFSTGILVAIAPGTDVQNVHASDIVGVDLDHVVVYFHQENPSGHDVDSGKQYFLSDVFRVPGAKGYHLAKRDTATAADIASFNACTFGSYGLCVRTSGYTDANEQDYEDWSFPRCIEAIPGAPACTRYIAPVSADAVAEDQRCLALETAHRPSGNSCTLASTRPENPAGFADPSTISLGHSVWEVLASGQGFVGPAAL